MTIDYVLNSSTDDTTPINQGWHQPGIILPIIPSRIYQTPSAQKERMPLHIDQVVDQRPPPPGYDGGNATPDTPKRGIDHDVGNFGNIPGETPGLWKYS